MTCSTSLSSSKTSDSILSFPASIFEKSSTSLITPSRVCDDCSIWDRLVFCSSFTTDFCVSFVSPTMAFTGVLISWLIRAKNSDFASVAFCRFNASSRNSRFCLSVITNIKNKRIATQQIVTMMYT